MKTLDRISISEKGEILKTNTETAGTIKFVFFNISNEPEYFEIQGV